MVTDQDADADTYQMYVYGHSDDLIEIDGDVREEFYANYGEPTYLFLGNTEIVAEYDGEWHFEVFYEGVTDTVYEYSVGRKKVVEQLNDYTEVVVVESPENTAKVLEA